MTENALEAAFEKFLLWEAATRDTIDFKKIYVDMTGDLVAGLMLSQIVYWHLPDREGQTRLRVERDGYLWLAKAHADWWNECRITVKQVKRALKILSQKQLIVVGHFQFSGMRTTHIRIDRENFLAVWQETLEGLTGQDQRDRPVGPKGTDRSGRKGPTDESQRDRPYTESTPETTTETKTKKTTTTAPKSKKGRPTATNQDTGAGVIDTETDDILLFLTEECSVWEQTAQALAANENTTLAQVVAWWVIIRDNNSINNPPAVLVHHLEATDPPPKFANQNQRHRYQQYLWDYQTTREDEE